MLHSTADTDYVFSKKLISRKIFIFSVCLFSSISFNAEMRTAFAFPPNCRIVYLKEDARRLNQQTYRRIKRIKRTYKRYCVPSYSNERVQTRRYPSRVRCRTPRTRVHANIRFLRASARRSADIVRLFLAVRVCALYNFENERGVSAVSVFHARVDSSASARSGEARSLLRARALQPCEIARYSFLRESHMWCMHEGKGRRREGICRHYT